MLAEARHSAIRAYVAAVVGCGQGDIAVVRRFEEGNRHDVYEVAAAARRGGPTARLVVRVSLADDPSERAQAEREAQVLGTLDGEGAPRLRDFSPTSPWFDVPVMSMDFVAGHHVSLDRATGAQLERLGEVVARVHDRPIGDLSEPLGPCIELTAYAARRLTSMLEGLTWVCKPIATPIRDRLVAAARSVEQDWERWRLAACFDAGEDLVLLHGDLASGNVLWSPDPVLVDWEYARLGDPADEIAYLFDQNGLAPTLRDAFWQGYSRGRADATLVAHVIERAAWWEPVTLLGSTLWWAERWVRRTDADASGAPDPATPRDPDYYSGEVLRRLDRLAALVRPPS